MSFNAQRVRFLVTLRFSPPADQSLSFLAGHPQWPLHHPRRRRQHRSQLCHRYPEGQHEGLRPSCEGTGEKFVGAYVKTVHFQDRCAEGAVTVGHPVDRRRGRYDDLSTLGCYVLLHGIDGSCPMQHLRTSCSLLCLMQRSYSLRIPPGSVDHRFSVWVFVPTEQKNTYLCVFRCFVYNGTEY